ncbi:hypothetical protein, partial [Victivallis lenta]|uniref:hypothetical protein n=1 Tax=Victivallis lenta TaxID=2606640 RepID=UPI003AF30D96
VEEDENKRSKTDFVLWFTKSKFDDQELKWDSSLTRSRNAADGKPTSNVAKRRFAPQSTPRPRRNNVSTGRRQRQNTRETSVSRVFSYILPLPEYEKTAESISAPSAVSVSASYYRSSAIWTAFSAAPFNT